MAIHNKNNFLFPVRSSDVEVFTKDVNNNSTYAINPNSVVFLQAVDINIVIKTKGTDNIILIPFSTSQEAIQALVLLKTALNQVINANTPIPEIGSFHHIQSVQSTVWTFTHGLDRMTAVSVMNDLFEEIAGLITYVDSDTVSIFFNTPVSGHAWI